MQSAGTSHVITLMDGEVEFPIADWGQFCQQRPKRGRGTAGRRVFRYTAKWGKHPGVQDAVISFKENEQ
jgi:hypothetical protein